MNRRQASLAVFGGAATAAAVAAPAPPCPAYFAAGLQDRWTRSRDYTLAVLAKMPDEHLSFRPTPDVWTFAQHFTHIGDGNLLLAAPLAGEPPVYAGQKPRELGRAELEKHIKESCAAGAKAFARLTTDAAAEETIEFFHQRVTKRELCYRMLDHAAHHRAQAIVYLRLKGIGAPPYAG